MSTGSYVVQLEKQAYAPEQGCMTFTAGDQARFTRSLTPIHPFTIAVTNTTLPPVMAQERPAPLPRPLLHSAWDV